MDGWAGHGGLQPMATSIRAGRTREEQEEEEEGGVQDMATSDGNLQISG